jgi:hypothetical protein
MGSPPRHRRDWVRKFPKNLPRLKAPQVATKHYSDWRATTHPYYSTPPRWLQFRGTQSTKHPYYSTPPRWLQFRGTKAASSDLSPLFAQGHSKPFVSLVFLLIHHSTQHVRSNSSSSSRPPHRWARGGLRQDAASRRGPFKADCGQPKSKLNQ